jgi:hypothetical protein
MAEGQVREGGAEVQSWGCRQGAKGSDRGQLMQDCLGINSVRARNGEQSTGVGGGAAFGPAEEALAWDPPTTPHLQCCSHSRIPAFSSWRWGADGAHPNSSLPALSSLIMEWPLYYAHFTDRCR